MMRKWRTFRTIVLAMLLAVLLCGQSFFDLPGSRVLAQQQKAGNKDAKKDAKKEKKQVQCF